MDQEFSYVVSSRPALEYKTVVSKLPFTVPILGQLVPSRISILHELGTCQGLGN